MRRNLLIGLLLFVLVFGLVACGSNAASEPIETNTEEETAVTQPAPVEEPPAEESEPAAAEETTTLVVWDVMTRPEENAIVDNILADYQAAHPNVTVQREAKNFDDLKTTASLALSSDDGPDIIQINQGESDMGALAAAGLLTPLNDYAEKYGWYDNFPGGLVALNSWTADGSQMGTGNLYGLPIQAEVVGVFYNKEKFEALGLDVPQSYAEFEETMAALKDAGETPLVFGNLDGWPAIHLYSELQNTALESRQWYDDFMYTTGDVTFEEPANIEAAKMLKSWVDSGYLSDGFEGIGYDDSWQLFSAGDGGMMLTGNWLTSEFLAGPNADKIGFFLLPPNEAGGYKLSVGGTGLAFAIRSGSENADLAAEYLNYLFSQETADALAEAGLLPVRPVDQSLLAGGMLGDVAKAWAHLIATDGVGYYMDWVTPTMYDTITSQLQSLMAGQITPEAFVSNVNADYAAFLAEKNG